MSGYVAGYKDRCDKITGAYYRLYRGFFLAVYNDTESRATQCALPPPADDYLFKSYRAQRNSDLQTPFALRITIVPVRTHSIGYDWRIEPIEYRGQ